MKPRSSNVKSSTKAPAEQVVKDIRRQTRRHFSAEDKIRIVLEEPVPKGLSDWGTRDSKGLFRPSWSERCGPQPLAGSIVARDFDMKRI